jgi:hypothetical protein
MKTKLTIIALLITVSLQAQIDVDKKYHAGAGMVIGTWGTFAGNSMNWKPEKAALFGVATAVTAGIGKELWDKIDYGRFDVKDVGATAIGGVIGAGLSYAALKIFKKPPVIYTATGKGFEIGVKIRL